jgi:hypothetical protein
MPHTAVVTFTARPLDWILQDRGSRDWRLDAERAAQAEYLVCTQNRHNSAFGAPTAPHGAAFLIARVSGVLPSEQELGRWRIEFSEYTVPEHPIPNIWRKSGRHRYPVWYTTLEELGIDLGALPPFQALPHADPPPADRPGGLSDVAERHLVPPARLRDDPWRHQPQADRRDVGARLDTLLAQFDRIPDRPGAIKPLVWDEHGLPR